MPAAELGELAGRERLVLHELSPQQASLEEAFMQLTAGSVEYHAHDGDPGATAGGARPPGGATGAGGDRWGAGWGGPAQRRRS
ncbi:ATP-binding cassette domain-containing protein OS=Streptomyces rutgersensis OX=53451 GN=F0345_20870 PE=4 SV=1 [Streptomyces diastaticus subsp. diastaticus]